MEALSTLWTFPVVVGAAMLIAWAAECGQFYVSQALALAVLAWLQTLPEFMVEAVIALEAAKDPEKTHLVIANFTGSLRLFLGFGWPMVYFVSAFLGKRRKESRFEPIHLEAAQSVSVCALLPALGYFTFIYWKGSLTLIDSAVLSAIYFSYLGLLSCLPPESAEDLDDLGRLPRWVMGRPKGQSITWIIGMFAVGGAALWFAAHPFLESMLALAVSMGVSQFVFVQWVAPFLSEFPEKLSAFHWARQVVKAPMALANFVSSSINQWTVLTALIPVVYSFGRGEPSAIVFDEHQKVEILLTIVQSYLGFLFLASMDFSWYEACGLFVLWAVQFFIPTLREEIIWVYGAWALFGTVRFLLTLRRGNAFSAFAGVLRSRLRRE